MNWLDIIADIQLPKLAGGKHDDPSRGLCAMEMIAYMERLEHTDAPPCTCPVIAAYVRGINDLMPEAQRQRLLPYLPRLVGTVAPEHERARGEYLAWAAITIFAPAALRAAGLIEQACALADFPKDRGLKAAHAAAYADAAAYAAAYAAAAAAHAAAYADAAAYAAAYAAAAAAHAAAYAAAYADAVYDDCFRVLDGLLAIGEPILSPTWTQERARELARIA
jgi:hypothetical protein